MNAAVWSIYVRGVGVMGLSAGTVMVNRQVSNGTGEFSYLTFMRANYH